MKCPLCRSKKISSAEEAGYPQPEKPSNIHWFTLVIFTVLYGMHFNPIIVPFMIMCVLLLAKPSLKEYYKDLTKWHNAMICNQCDNAFFFKDDQAYKYN